MSIDSQMSVDYQEDVILKAEIEKFVNICLERNGPLIDTFDDAVEPVAPKVKRISMAGDDHNVLAVNDEVIELVEILSGISLNQSAQSAKQQSSSSVTKSRPHRLILTDPSSSSMECD
ncbi:uncharacterized protein LOC119687076 [Teleopsis dalmanni]|uniref:uncharacterized protein LOC119687076 n=1 Tax=Teleopsis dalmanni TaxID=139649 RepID=UPI0018CCC7D0|nr:uncharacterized protein LOC119687076 [Teleopsis dalmanni]XP_037957181.1 uncharacterized protein LOC119687076 [Teleopsis dalmanni]XP_037957182.1 uncharacterized protein LOC119687076 [Teleopsis dalmanni]